MVTQVLVAASLIVVVEWSRIITQVPGAVPARPDQSQVSVDQSNLGNQEN